MEEKGGSYILKPQKAAGETREFSYEILPTLKSNGQSFNDWFSNAIDKDLQQQGLELPSSAAKKNITNNQTIFSFSSQVTDKKGKDWYVTYVSYQASARECRLARIMCSPDVKYYATNMRPVASHFGDLAKQEAAQPEVAQAPVVRREEEAVTPIAMVGNENGLGSRDVNGVLILLNYNTSPDGKMTRAYSPYLVLNDGSIFSEPVASPYTFNVKASKQNEPTKWGTWKMKNNVMSVSWAGKSEPEKWAKNWFWATPAIPNEKIEGTFVTVTGKVNDNLRGTNTQPTSTISFNSMGEFTLSTSGGNADFSKRDEAGTYTLNEYGIELRFNNGTVIRRAFYFYLQGKTHFGIGNFVYAPKRNDQ
jgi:hypothetical protein